MPKVKWDVDSEQAEPAKGFKPYDGPLPRAGIYRLRLKQLKMKLNKNDEDMLSILAEIDEDGDKKQYNGYGVWANQNITEQGKPFLQAMLDAWGIPWNDFYKKCVSKEEETPTDIIAIGKVKFPAHDSYDEDRPIMVRAQLKRGKNQDGEPNMQVAQWLPLVDEEDEDDDDDSDDDSDDPPF